MVCWEAGKAAKVEEIEVDTPKAGEVRVKMLFASLCHTDVLCCKGFPIVRIIYIYIFPQFSSFLPSIPHYHDAAA